MSIGREESDGGLHWTLSITSVSRELWEVRLERLLEPGNGVIYRLCSVVWSWLALLIFF